MEGAPALSANRAPDEVVIDPEPAPQAAAGSLSRAFLSSCTCGTCRVSVTRTVVVARGRKRRLSWVHHRKMGPGSMPSRLAVPPQSVPGLLHHHERLQLACWNASCRSVFVGDSRPECQVRFGHRTATRRVCSLPSNVCFDVLRWLTDGVQSRLSVRIPPAPYSSLSDSILSENRSKKPAHTRVLTADIVAAGAR
jgi:hypothetical protein